MKYRIVHILKHKRRTKRIKDSKSLCGKSYYGNSVVTDFSQPGVVCRVCDRISADCWPDKSCMWSFSWSREDIDPKKCIRETAIIGQVTVTAIHSRHLTRIWFRYGSTTKNYNNPSVKSLANFTKSWVDTKFYCSTTLQEYLDHMAGILWPR